MPNSGATVGNAKARILVVDDHPMVRGGLIRLIDQQSDMMCCGEAGQAMEVQTSVARNSPDLVVLDLRLHGSDGLDLIKCLKAQFSGLKILILSQYDAPMYVERALQAGALGYVVKEQAGEEVLCAIRTVLTGEVYLTRAMASRLLHRFVGPSVKGRRSGIENLTDRELHVLQSLGSGMSTREIAGHLNLSFKTIETHRENIKRKLGINTASELIHFACEWAREQVSVPPEMISEAKPGPEPP